MSVEDCTDRSPVLLSQVSETAPSECWVTVSPVGDVDVVTAPALFDRVLEASAGNRLGVVVDFAAVTFVDTAGVDALDLARRVLASSGRQVLVRHPTKLLIWMLDLFDLSDMIERPANPADAVVPGSSAAPGLRESPGVADGGLSEVLTEFARTMVTDFPIQAILDRLVERIVEVLPLSAAGVTLISPGTSPVYVAASDADALRFEALQSALGEGPCLLAYATGRPVCIPDVRDDLRFGKFSPAAARAGLGAVFAFPLRHGDDPLGALDLYCDEPAELSPATMHAARTLADVAAAYILNARARAELLADVERARERTRRDELTGLANRASLLEDLGRTLHQAGGPGHSLTVVFADIDRFKEVNDLHGHRAGDELLVAAGARLSALVRSGDTLARLSGDEFVVVFLDLADVAQVEAIARRVATSLSKPFVLSGVVVASTTSVGVVYTTTGGHSPGELLHAADMAMYEAKRRGGGRYHLVTSGSAPTDGSDRLLVPGDDGAVGPTGAADGRRSSIPSIGGRPRSAHRTRRPPST